MRYGSVCSGIEAATVAWHGLGWKPAWFSEIEKFPSAVLAHHYPNVANRGDMTRFKEWHEEPTQGPGAIDLLVGGTPCQSFSVAGLRKGLADPRGNLMLTYLAIADRYRPRWLVWENVPGVLSSNGGKDFGALLGGLGELGYGWAYRVLDAQYFGVAQRRRRVFVVGHLGDWRPAAAVLFERQSLQGHPAPRRQARKGAAAGFETGPGGGRFTDLAPTLDCRAKNGPMQNQLGAGVIAPEQARALLTKANKLDSEEDGTGRGTPLVPVAQPIAFRDDVTPKAQDDLAFTLTQPGGNPQMVAQPIAVSETISTREGAVTDTAHAVASMAFKIRGGSPEDTGEKGSTTPGRAAGKGFLGDTEKAFTLGATQDEFLAAPALTASNNPSRSPQSSEVTQQVAAVHAAAMVVRRLTPRECERLQGFPDDYTAIPYRGKPADGPRYKALGNSMAVPVMAWIGKRIQQVEEIMTAPTPGPKEDK